MSVCFGPVCLFTQGVFNLAFAAVLGDVLAKQKMSNLFINLCGKVFILLFYMYFLNKIQHKFM